MAASTSRHRPETPPGPRPPRTPSTSGTSTTSATPSSSMGAPRRGGRRPSRRPGQGEGSHVPPGEGRALLPASRGSSGGRALSAQIRAGGPPQVQQPDADEADDRNEPPRPVQAEVGDRTGGQPGQGDGEEEQGIRRPLAHLRGLLRPLGAGRAGPPPRPPGPVGALSSPSPRAAHAGDLSRDARSGPPGGRQKGGGGKTEDKLAGLRERPAETGGRCDAATADG